MPEHAAAGKVLTGFTKPYVALYQNDAGTVSYTGGRELARGVDVDLSVTTADNKIFYANNGAAESSGGKFKSGTCKLTVDGLHEDAEEMIAGLPEAKPFEYGTNKTADYYDYDDDQAPPYVGIGFIMRYVSADVETWVPIILTKAKFDAISLKGKTQEEEIDYQTQELNAVLHRDDSAKHSWRKLFTEQETEAEAEAIIKAFFSIT